MRHTDRAVPNPARPGTLRPIELITDRAKRYRANANPPPKPKQCGFCGSKGNIDLDHIDGHESNDAQHNKMWLCRRCNATKGSLFARHGFGTRTMQFNPGRNPTPTIGQYIHAALVLRQGPADQIPGAVAIMHATSKAKRREYTQEIWTRRRQKFGPTGRKPGQGEIPF